MGSSFLILIEVQGYFPFKEGTLTCDAWMVHIYDSTIVIGVKKVLTDSYYGRFDCLVFISHEWSWWNIIDFLPLSSKKHHMLLNGKCGLLKLVQDKWVVGLQVGCACIGKQSSTSLSIRAKLASNSHFGSRSSQWMSGESNFPHSWYSLRLLH